MTSAPAPLENGAEPLRRLLLMRWFAVAGWLALVTAAHPLLAIELPLAPMLAIVALLAGSPRLPVKRSSMVEEITLISSK